MTEGTIRVGGVTYVWELEPHQVYKGHGKSREGFYVICNANPIGFIRDHTDHESMPGWYGEPDPDGVGTSYGPIRDVESIVRRIIATHHEIAHKPGAEIDAFASDPQASGFDVYIGGTNDCIARIVRVSEGTWRAYLIAAPEDEPIRTKGLKEALERLAALYPMD